VTRPGREPRSKPIYRIFLRGGGKRGSKICSLRTYRKVERVKRGGMILIAIVARAARELWILPEGKDDHFTTGVKKSEKKGIKL